MNQQTEPNIQPSKILLFSITVFKAVMNTTEEYMKNPVDIESFNFGLNHDFAFNIIEKQTRLRLFFQIDATGEDGNIVGVNAEYGIEFHFKIENYEDFATVVEEKVEANVGFAATILGIAYSTARGIILERTQGTFLDAAIIPIINPNEVVTNP